MSLGQWSDAAKQVQFDALVDMFEPDRAWLAWVFDVAGNGRVELPRVATPYTREKSHLVFHLPPELSRVESEYAGWIVGAHVYIHEHDTEWTCLTGWVGNTNAITPGALIETNRLTMSIP